MYYKQAKEYLLKRGDLKFKLKEHEFNIFLSKYIGCFVSRGKYAIALNKYIELLFNIKKSVKLNPFETFRIAVVNLLPVVGTRMLRLGKTLHAIPTYLSKRGRRFNVLFKWLLRSHRNKSNVRGVNVKELSRHIVAAATKRGVLMRVKKNYIADSLLAMHMLYKKKMRRRNPRPLARKVVLHAYNKELNRNDPILGQFDRFVPSVDSWLRAPYNKGYVEWKTKNRDHRDWRTVDEWEENW